MSLSESEKRLLKITSQSKSALGPFSSVVLTIWIAASMFLAGAIASDYLLLGYLYGFSRVHRENIHYTYSPPGKSCEDFILSNGDHISNAQHFLAFPMTLGVWFVLILSGYIIIKFFSRRC
jgi:hypothetical protein